MSSETLHPDELAIDSALVRRLVASQFPQWSDRALERVPSAGTVNALYRLGADMVVRLPRLAQFEADLDKEHKWLPRLAPLLPIAVPAPIVMGTAEFGYPCRWSVFQWLEGESARTAPVDDEQQAALTLADFVAALRRVDPTGAPVARPRDRGGVLAIRDGQTRAAIVEVAGAFDGDALITVWETSLAARAFETSPVWIHTDLLPDNLLVTNGRLGAVIDFGSACRGDPACDLTVAWSLLSADSRDAFRTALGADDAAWARGRGWALNQALVALPYYRDTNPAFATVATRMINEILTDHAQSR